MAPPLFRLKFIFLKGDVNNGRRNERNPRNGK